MPASTSAARKPRILRFMGVGVLVRVWRGRGSLADHLHGVGAVVIAVGIDVARRGDLGELAAEVDGAALRLGPARVAVVPLVAGESVTVHAEAGEAGDVVPAVRAVEV